MEPAGDRATFLIFVVVVVAFVLRDQLIGFAFSVTNLLLG